MNFKAKNGHFRTIIACVCSFVGVGFVSGAELWYYFARFESGMIFGFIFFFILSCLLFYFSFSKSNENIILMKAKNFVAIISEVIISSAMISGIRNCSKLFFGNLYFIFIILSIVIIFIILIKGKNVFVFYNDFVIIFIVFIIVYLFLNNNNNFNLKIENMTLKNAIYSVIYSVCYIFMNIAEIKPILLQESKNLSNKNKFMISLLLSLTLEILMILFILILFFNKNIVNNSLPILLLFNNKNKVIKYIFFVGLIMCLISTAIACLLGLKNRLFLKINDNIFNTILVIILSLILGLIDFKFFIKYFYPIIAILNFFIFILDLKFLKNR